MEFVNVLKVIMGITAIHKLVHEIALETVPAIKENVDAIEDSKEMPVK